MPRTAPHLLLLTLLVWPTQSPSADDLILLLQTRSCQACQLNDSDLTHADLRNTNLKGTDLQRANLSQAKLDGADLSGSDLSFTSFQGASLRGADLRNCRLIGTDLRKANLTGALLDKYALEQSHWVGAEGISKVALSHAGLHNAGVDAAQTKRWAKAEQLFDAAIEANPDEPLSWVARGLSRGEQGKENLASSDFAYAGQLFAKQGNLLKAHQLHKVSQHIYDTTNKTNSNNFGLGSALIGGAISTIQLLAPIALKALTQMIP